MTEPTTQAAVPPAPADQDLRDRIAVVLAEADGYEYAKGLGLRDMSTDTQQHYDKLADAVLAVLPASTSPAPRVTSHTYEGDGGPCTAEAYGQTCGAPRPVHELDEGHAPLLPEREAEIRARAADEHLTPGPWRLDRESCDCGGDYPCGHGMYVTGIVTPTPTWAAAERAKRTGEQPRDYDFHRSEICEFTGADWELMAHARADVPALLAELDRVRAERDRYVAELERLNLEHWEDQPIRGVLDEIHAERCRQNEKWGEQNHPDVDPRDIPYVTHSYYASRADIWRQVNEERTKPSRSLGRCTGHPEGPHTHTAWDGILLEEVYEALAEEDPARLRAEMVQVAAVAVAWVEAIDRRGAVAPAEGSGH
ncbi:hypothetical protein [Streptomyces sp. NPDC094472]|uniref:hypothetical protein n=1 Tax=Streptomyces sp. NPDC094472 TaxID=3155080 RepID=UPI00332BFA6E